MAKVKWSNLAFAFNDLCLCLWVIGVMDFYETPRPCMAMRLIKGGDLKNYLTNNDALPAKEAMKVLRGIGHGLKHLHDHNIIHRDMKSPNILIQLPSMEPVLIDLGMGKWFRPLRLS